jgi:hypothetical protein
MQGCEMLRILHILDTPLTDGSEVVRAGSAILLRSISGIIFCYGQSKPYEHGVKTNSTT